MCLSSFSRARSISAIISARSRVFWFGWCLAAEFKARLSGESQLGPAQMPAAARQGQIGPVGQSGSGPTLAGLLHQVEEAPRGQDVLVQVGRLGRGGRQPRVAAPAKAQRLLHLAHPIHLGLLEPVASIGQEV